MGDVDNTSSMAIPITEELEYILDSSNWTNMNWENASTPSTMSTLGTLSFIFRISLSFVILVVNTLNILVACHPQFNYPISSRVTMVSMSTSDCLLGVSIMVATVFARWRQYFCRLFLVVNVTCVRVSVVSLILVIVDRYLAIAYPFRHQRYATKQVCIALVLSAWVLVTIVDIIENAMGDYVYDPRRQICDVRHSATRSAVSTAVVYFIPLTAMIIVYTHLLSIVRRITRRMIRIYPLQALSTNQSRISAPSTSAPTSEFPVAPNMRQPDPRTPDHYNGNFKIVLTFFTVTLCFTLTNLPNRVVRLMLLLRGPGTVPPVVTLTSRLVLISGSCWNFLIFSLMNATFRNILKKFFRPTWIYQLSRLRMGARELSL